jgi:hypothetical protein
MQTFKNPILQKRHYEFIADILKELREDSKKELKENPDTFDFSLGDVIAKFAGKFAKINPLFDKQKFLDRIGIK